MAKTTALETGDYEAPTLDEDSGTPGGTLPSDIYPNSAANEGYDISELLGDTAPVAVAPAAVDTAVTDIELVSLAVVVAAPAPAAVAVIEAALAGRVGPAKMDQSVPKLSGGTVLDYAMAVDVDQRPVVALIQAFKKMLAVGAHMDEVVAFVGAAVKHMQAVEGFSGRARKDLNEYLFDDKTGVLEKFKATFETERALNRKAATGGLVDAAIEVEKLVEKFGNVKLGEFDAHAVQKTLELDREMHRITLSSLQSTLEAIVSEKASLAADRAQLDAANKYSRRMGIAYAVAGLFAGLAIAFGTIALH